MRPPPTSPPGFVGPQVSPPPDHLHSTRSASPTCAAPSARRCAGLPPRPEDRRGEPASYAPPGGARIERCNPARRGAEAAAPSVEARAASSASSSARGAEDLATSATRPVYRARSTPQGSCADSRAALPTDPGLRKLARRSTSAVSARRRASPDVHDDELYVVDVAGGQPGQFFTSGAAAPVRRTVPRRVHRPGGVRTGQPRLLWSDDGQRSAPIGASTTPSRSTATVHQRDQLGAVCAGGGIAATRSPVAPNARCASSACPGRRRRCHLDGSSASSRVPRALGGSRRLPQRAVAGPGAAHRRLDPAPARRRGPADSEAPWRRRAAPVAAAPGGLRWPGLLLLPSFFCRVFFFFSTLHDDLRLLEKGAGELAGAFLVVERAERLPPARAGAPATADRSGDSIQGTWPIDHARDRRRGARRVYFTGRRERPTEQHLFMVLLAGGDDRPADAEPGVHGVVVDLAKRRFVDVHSSVRHPTRLSLRSARRPGALIEEPADRGRPAPGQLDLPAAGAGQLSQPPRRRAVGRRLPT